MNPAKDAAIDVRDALKLLKDPHIQANKHRLGAIGSQDIDNIVTYLERAARKLPLPDTKRFDTVKCNLQTQVTHSPI